MLTWRRLVIVACLVVPAAVALSLFVHVKGDDPVSRLEVTWGANEGDPGCVYDPARQVVNATLAVHYEALGHDTVTVTVTAYADENTSDEVGAATGSADVADTTETIVPLTIQVTRPPHVDEDGIAACRVSVTDSKGLAEG